MSKVTECSICFERYNNNKKIPKILHCGHTFCKNCLNDMKNKYNNILECPICRKKELFSNVDDLATNRTIFDLLYNPTQENDLVVEGRNKYKVIIIGSSFTGKTSLLIRCIKKKFNEEYNVTLGAEIFNYTIKKNNETINLDIWDTAGTEKFQSIQKIYCMKTYAAIIVFDVGNRDTFDSIPNWIYFYKENKSRELNDMIYLVGNKIDIGNKRKVSKEEAEEFAKLNNLKYYEVSAKSGDNVEKLFDDIGEDISRVYKNGNIFVLNNLENSIKTLDRSVHLNNNLSCWDKFIASIKNIIFFWKE